MQQLTIQPPQQQSNSVAVPKEIEKMNFNFGGVTIEVTAEGDVNISGANNLSFDANKISFHAVESMDINVDGDVYVGSSTHIINQAPRVDINPDAGRKTGYKTAESIKKLIRTFDGYYESWRDFYNACKPSGY